MDFFQLDLVSEKNLTIDLIFLSYTIGKRDLYNDMQHCNQDIYQVILYLIFQKQSFYHFNDSNVLILFEEENAAVLTLVQDHEIPF